MDSAFFKYFSEATIHLIFLGSTGQLALENPNINQ